MVENGVALSEERTEKILNGFYKKYHRAEYIDPDPLVFPRRYSDRNDIEVAAFIASSLALGRVNLIINFLERLFSRLGEPFQGLCLRSEEELISDFKDFKYRFFTSDDISLFLIGLRRIYIEYGNLENCFMSQYESPENIGGRGVVEGLSGIYRMINSDGQTLKAGCRGGGRNIVSNPVAGSACKRMNLFLRWVVRDDEIDLGLWHVPAEILIIPLDTHVMRVSRFLGLTARKSPDFKTACEITDSLKRFDKEDPVKYDFSMSRIGIHPALSYSELETYLI